MEFLIEYGYIGVFIASFLAATILPFSSEVVLTGVLLAGAAYAPCMLSATLGNFLGGMSCYWLGMLGKSRLRALHAVGHVGQFSRGDELLLARHAGQDGVDREVPEARPR